jgi:hypothetical protein
MFEGGYHNEIASVGKTVTKLISIDSLFRADYSTSQSNDFIWKMNSTESNVQSLRLVSFELPVMWYDVSDKNGTNTFTMTIEGDTVTSNNKEQLIKIESGIYTAKQMSTILNNIISNKFDKRVNFSISDITGKSSFRFNSIEGVPLPDEISYSLDFNNYKSPGQDSLGIFLGFTDNKYVVMGNESTASVTDYTGVSIIEYYGVLESSKSYMTGVFKYIYLSVDDFVKNHTVTSVTASNGNIYLGDNILGRIPVKGDAHSIIVSSEASSGDIFKKRDYTGPVNLNNLRIRLLDKFGRPLDINNNDFSLALEITSSY